MIIPKIYSDILEKDISLKGQVYSTTERFGEILAESQLYFFEEYTDHGIKHIEAVLHSILDLTPQKSLIDFFDAENVTAIILSVILHDIGMHHTYKTFTALVNQKNIHIPELDKLSWSELWENYIEEGKKFNAQQKNDIFGDYDYIVTTPDLADINKLDGYQKKFIGEFLRRHHARIAHETALVGFNTGSEIIQFANEYDYEKRDIVGLIARSHGMEIRDTYNYLRKKFYKINRTPYNIHVYYLMTLLRLGDYFQIDIRRLSLVSLKLRTFTSPISETEHTKHFAIKEIQPVEDDPEMLYVRALPQSNFIYWKLNDLIFDIQSELDKCWAILGEKYGKDSQKPLLKYRRLVSNLNDDDYLDTISFIPEKILFGSDADLARLLVEPLYGDNPTYGVRELIQNSVDAIHERIFLEKLDESFNSLIEINILHDSKEEYFFEIKDNGKGMNVKEIKNYFLKAGATNRKSKEWDDFYLDSERNSQVLKSGKFGVGILAAFLIGGELEVKTRRYDSEFGLCFKATINSKDIEVDKLNNMPIGTHIKIRINQETISRFNDQSTLVSWDKWYTLKKPKIVYNSILTNTAKMGYEVLNPSYFEDTDEWQDFFATGYSKLRWSYSNKERPKNSKYQLTCNGLIIPSPPIIYSGSIPAPNIQIFDFNGILPINLSRNMLDSNCLPFEKELIQSIYKMIVIKILGINPQLIIYENSIKIVRSQAQPKLFGGINIDDFYAGFTYTTKGYYIKNRYLSNVLKEYKVIRLQIAENDEIDEFPISIQNNYVFEIFRSQSNTSSIKGYFYDTVDKKIEWAFLRSDSDYEWFAKDLDYTIEKPSIFSQKIVVVKRKDIRKIPLNFALLSNDLLNKIQSIICFSSVSHFRQLNNEFNNYIISSLNENIILSYSEEERQVFIDKFKKAP